MIFQIKDVSHLMDFKGTKVERCKRTLLLQGDPLGCLGKARPRQNVSKEVASR